MADIEVIATKRTTLYRMVDDTTVESAFVEERRTTTYDYESTPIQLEGQPALLVRGAITSSAKWTNDVALLTGESVSLKTSSPGAALAVQDKHGTVWAVTWGTGFHFLDSERIDFRFGPGVVARSALPMEIKSLTKTILDHRARVDRSSLPNGSTVRDLGVDGYGEVVSRIEAKARIPGLGVGDDVIQVRAAESLNLPLSKRADHLLEDLEVLHKLSEQEVLQGLESLEQLVALKPRDRQVPRLEQMLLNDIYSGENTTMGLSWPHERLNIWGPVVACKVTGLGDRKVRISNDVPVIDEVLGWLREVPREQLLARLDAIRIELHSSPDPEPSTLVATTVPLRRWLAFEVREDGQRFCLHDGRWYRMDDQYLDRIDRRVVEILARPAPVQFPAWPLEEDEKDYNLRAAKALGGLSMDRKLITTPLHSRGGIEPCDIYLSPGKLIHVKRGRSSADLSHLLAQGLVSTDSLARDDTARTAWTKRVLSESEGTITDASVTDVVLAIGTPKPLTIETLFTFTKVNLVKQADALHALDVVVTVCAVPQK
ncbi:TIGR04141 family sporadically distributed protein [Frigoribacterium sp. CFBP 8766]|uniref:DUF6119 family protein n=1 Tax=Frigoribacterium sp. CFBP 8766 TaxID=2775273 RepID=UPI00177AB7F0|nr:DUF6119 family protein [Frigoribacterium sp. CFBP 8766]MBD8583350.1 TIGR04141 family sporadically distributed protein [Frigoribacterium sp. CFBP 8766]